MTLKTKIGKHRSKPSDPTIRWMKVRSIGDGCWITLNMDAIATIAPCGYGFSMRMLGGQSIILDKEEGNRVLKKILPEGIRP